MPKFEVELKRVVDDSYEIEIGHGLVDQVVADLKHGLAGKVHKFAIITDSNVEPLYARPLEQKLAEEGIPDGCVYLPGWGKEQDAADKGDAGGCNAGKGLSQRLLNFWLLAVA